MYVVFDEKLTRFTELNNQTDEIVLFGAYQCTNRDYIRNFDVIYINELRYVYHYNEKFIPKTNYVFFYHPKYKFIAVDIRLPGVSIPKVYNGKYNI